MRFIHKLVLSLFLSTMLSVPVMAQTRFDYFFIEAEKARISEDWSSAMSLYQHCLDIRPDAPEALYHLGRINMYLRRDSIGLDLFQRSLEKDPDNPTYLETLASLYIRQQKVEEAIPLLERMARLQSARTDVLSQLVNIYKSLGRTEDAIRILDKIEVLEGKLSQITDEKYILYMDMGDSVQAFREVQSLCDEFPNDQNYRLHMGYCFQQCGNYDRAKEIYDSVAEIDPDNQYLKSALMSYYQALGENDKYIEVRDSVLFSSNTQSEERYATMNEYIQSEARDSAGDARIVAVFDKILEKTPNDVPMLTLYASFLLYRQIPEDKVADLMHRVLGVEPDNQIAMRWLLEYYAKRENYASLEEICRRGVNYNPEVLGYHFYLGLTLLQQGKDQETADVLKNGLKTRDPESDPDVVSEMFTLLGDMYYRMKMAKEAFNAYDSALVYKKDNVVCLNNYAYFLSLEVNRLDEAEEMGYRAIKAEPGNKTYLDTYAWILFAQGNYSEAQHYMERVVSADSTDEYLLNQESLPANILEHAADIAWHCGNRTQAIRLWNIAFKKDDDTATPLLIKKVKKKKYVK